MTLIRVQSNRERQQHESYSSLLKATADLNAKNKRLREALNFYADPDTYFAISFLSDPPCGDFMEDGEEIDGRWRPGKKARDALKEMV